MIHLHKIIKSIKLKIAVVILNWNGKNLLEKFLPSITKFSNKAEIIVADNASDDESVSWLKTTYPEVRIIENSINGGYAKGYNDALKHVDADIFALVNSDIEVSENWLESISTLFTKDNKIAAIQPKILDYKNKSKFEFAGATGGFIDKFGYPYCRGRVFTEIEEDNNQFEEESEIFWASGACIFIKKDVFNDLEGFDEDYFAHMEEIDLCWRIHNSGYKIMYQPKSVVYHVGGATLQESNPQKTYLNFRNSLFTIIKNAPKKNLFGLILTRLILDAVASVKFIFEGHPKHMFSIIRAHLSFYAGLNKMLNKRIKGFDYSKKYYIHESVVFQFYILGRRYFKDLK